MASEAKSCDLPLSGKVAVITGASGGIGAGIALALAEAGAKVALGARRKDALAEVGAGPATHASCYVSNVSLRTRPVTVDQGPNRNRRRRSVRDRLPSRCHAA